MAHFEVGKKVVALVNITRRYNNGAMVSRINKGDIFILQQVRKGTCDCSPLIIDIGFNSDVELAMCNSCGVNFKNNGAWWFASQYFAPLEEDEISETTYEDIMAKIESTELIEK